MEAAELGFFSWTWIQPHVQLSQLGWRLVSAAKWTEIMLSVRIVFPFPEASSGILHRGRPQWLYQGNKSIVPLKIYSSSPCIFLFLMCACIRMCSCTEARRGCQVYPSITLHLILSGRVSPWIWGSFSAGLEASEPHWPSCLTTPKVGFAGMTYL